MKSEYKKKTFSQGEIIKIKNSNIENPGKIIFVDKTALCKYKYLITKMNEKFGHWYSCDEIEIIKDEKIKELVNKWYLRNEKTINACNTNRMIIKNF